MTKLDLAYWESLKDPKKRRIPKKSPNDTRTFYEVDYANVVRSSSFRRLQDKAQVFPLKRNDYVRTRLTHSIEASSVASSFGKHIARKLFDDQKDATFSNHMGVILSTATLVHDIGNPPFGHFGEHVISDFFKNFLEERKDLNLTAEQKFDLTNFDGNAQGFRILTKLQYHEDEYGLNLSDHVLGTFMKYTASARERIEIKAKIKSGAMKKKDTPLHHKKIGYFQSEKETFDWLDSSLKLKGRHPFAFLLEASDDISYLTADLIDGFKKGAFTWTTFKDSFKKSLGKEHPLWNDFCDKKEKLKKANASNYRQTLLKIFKPRFESVMFTEAQENFIKNHDEIISGNFESELITHTEGSDGEKLHSFLSDISFNRVYLHEEVLQTEIVASKVLNELLEMFTSAALSEDKLNTKTLEGKIYKFISDDFKFILNSYGDHSCDYEKLLLVTDFISGMTDSYAIALHKNLVGI